MDIIKASQYNDISLYVREVNALPMLTPEEERALAIRYVETKDIEAAKRLVTANLRFVIKIAFEYVNYGISLLDIIQEGNLGLMMAVKKFDPYKNYRLISYAIWWIRAYIQDYIMDNYSLVKMGTTQNQRKLFYNFSKLKNELTLKNTSTAEINSRIAESLDVTPVEVDEMELRLSARDFSLEYNPPDSEMTVMETIPDYRENHVLAVEENDENLNTRKTIASALQKLTEKERYVIEHRILCEEPHTLQDVGANLGITRERVRQIESAALQKLKKLLAV